jgi:hypothetical protein
MRGLSRRFASVILLETVFPKSLKVSDRLRATFSRAIASGVASTFNATVHRLQLAAANSVAFSMIHHLPDSRRSSNTRLQLSKIYANLNRVSSGQLPLISLTSCPVTLVLAALMTVVCGVGVCVDP